MAALLQRQAVKRYAIQTFGCQMNVHDSERMHEVLSANGYTITDEPSLADLIVINTCSVRDKAEHKLMSLLGTLRPLKERKGVVLAVGGCVAQQEGERLLKKAPHVDLVFGPDNIAELPTLLNDRAQARKPIARTVFDVDRPAFVRVASSARARPVSDYVTVMKGCDERCTFCIVPHTRGPERYRSVDEIVGDVRRLVAQGVAEVTLLGQTVNSWYDPTSVALTKAPRSRPSRSAFAGLLRTIAAEVPGLARLRYTSPHPRHVTDELVRTHADLEVLPAHVHLPVQSGSDAVLKRMARRYTRAHYIERAHALVQARPGLTLSTDIIVGFPGETDEDFEQTLSLVREVGFVAGFCFKYSPRPMTPALKLGDDVVEAVKDERLARLFAVIEAQQTAHLNNMVGTKARVLVEQAAPDKPGFYRGRTERNEIVHLSADEPCVGRVVTTQITEAFAHSLGGAAVVPRRLPLAAGEGA